MENTEFKLSEAKFFLEKLKENNDKRNEFDYYLNAYINSSRAVLWIMRSEYCKVAGWEKWFNEKELSNEDQILLKEIRDTRNRSIKQKPLKVETYYTIHNNGKFIDIKDELKRFDGKKISLSIEEYDLTSSNEELKKEDNNSIQICGKLKSSVTIEEFKNEDIIGVCSKYFDLLQSIVEECISKFN